jgi:hypothetical protein
VSAPPNPPAFPTPDGGITGFNSDDGMTLRDYFAAAALAVIGPMMGSPKLLRTDGGTDPLNQMDIAASAYLIADAMLAERSKP